jgi:hypothetical protein
VDEVDFREWFKRGKYWYRKPDGRGPHEIKNCENCDRSFLARRSKIPTQSRFCSLSCSRQGSLNPAWRGDSVKYRGAHLRVARMRGKASSCSISSCVTNSSKFHWASLTENWADPNDYAMMCVFHHRAFDWAKILGMTSEEALKTIAQISTEVQITRSKGRCS